MGQESRDDIASAIQELSQDGGAGPASGTAQAPAGEVAAETGGAPVVEDAGTALERAAAARDTAGRYAPKTPAQDPLSPDKQPKQEVATDLNAAVAAAAKPSAADKAPGSWKPEEREGWDKLDPRHKAAISRRELETQQALSTSADARRHHSEFNALIQPYMPFIVAEKSTPMQAVKYMMDTAAALRVGTPAHKAQLIAGLVRDFGGMPLAQLLDEALDHALNKRGAPPQDGPAHHIMQAIDQKLAPFQQLLTNQNGQTERQMQHLQDAAQQMQDAFFNDPANEYVLDVKDMMSDLMDAAANRGQILTLQDAYKAATLAHPTIRNLVANRQQANGTAQHTAAARRALEASASLPSNGGAPSRDGGQGDSDGSLRGDLLASVASLQRTSR